MSAIAVIAVFDIGKTNKKLFLFDEQYRIVWERSAKFEEIPDEDGFPCEDLQQLSQWVKRSYSELLSLKQYRIKAVNFCAYGASFVHMDEQGQPVTPLYNYLKPYPEQLATRFYAAYGGKVHFSMKTASPALGHLNSGLQLYWLKHQKPELFQKIEYSLHLPQYLAYLITGVKCSDITSIGCHTALWDFQQKDYHSWVHKEGVYPKFAPIYKGSDVSKVSVDVNNVLPVGVGLHDSSAALIPYLATCSDPFVLISTGTWCISLNPFNTTPLTEEELSKDCLCYLSYEGSPVKASRLFAGYEHEGAVKKIAARFQLADDFYKGVHFDQQMVDRLNSGAEEAATGLVETPFKGGTQPSLFSQRNLSAFHTPEAAYHRLIMDIVDQQVASTRLVLAGASVQKIFVDGGFGKNAIYMNLLSQRFPEHEVYAASIAQATALGAAMAIHQHWNPKPIPSNIIELEYYRVAPANALS